MEILDLKLDCKFAEKLSRIIKPALISTRLEES